jgi:hypothetical protein
LCRVNRLVDAQWDDKTRWDDKINAVFWSAQMGSAQTYEEQVALVENSDLYQRGYAKQSIATKRLLLMRNEH